MESITKNEAAETPCLESLVMPRVFKWRDIGDGRPVKVQVCPDCGIAPSNVDDCGHFGDCMCPYFGVGEAEANKMVEKLNA